MATTQEKTVATIGTLAVIGAVIYFVWYRPKKQKELLAEISSDKEVSQETQSFSSADCGCGA